MSITFADDHVVLSDAVIRVRAAGPAGAAPIVFLHGWPEDATAWDALIERAAGEYRCIAIDLPGIGGSRLRTPNGEKDYCARIMHELIGHLGLHEPTLVGHDAGGMIAFAYLRQFDDLRAAVIMDTVIPGVPPWEKVLANPYLWHFSFHSIPGLPERLVRSDIRAYFDYFYDAITARPEAITDTQRDAYVRSYSRPEALTQGFELYRALHHDARQNAADARPITTPMLYLRGEREGGVMADYETGFRGAGIQHLTTALIPGAGHFTAEEAPEETWNTIGDYLQRQA